MPSSTCGSAVKNQRGSVESRGVAQPRTFANMMSEAGLRVTGPCISSLMAKQVSAFQVRLP